MFNGTMMQYFEWFLLPKCKLWNEALNEAENLRELGISALWLPPAYKGIGGIYDVGYGAYDLYDLGEFNQKGTVETKYGSKDEYLQAIKKLKENNIQDIIKKNFNKIPENDYSLPKDEENLQFLLEWGEEILDFYKGAMEENFNVIFTVDI